MAQVNQRQRNGSSHADELLTRISREFTEAYDEWLPQRNRVDEAQIMRRGQVQVQGQGQGQGQTARTLNDLASSHGASEVKRRETKSRSPDHVIHGFENEILSLKSFMLNQKDSDDFNTLAVVGRYGVGKTALCQKMFNDDDIKNAYVPRLWVSMYKDGDKEDNDPKTAAVKRILDGLGVEHGEDEELARLLYVLYLNLWGKKYLIVLDDVRRDDGWGERLDHDVEEHIPHGKPWGTHLSCGFPKGSGGRIIITSRDEKLAKELVGEEHKLHRLYPLSDTDIVWKIYKDAAKASNHDVIPRNKRKYKEDVMNKSCGIPLVARMLGKNEPIYHRDVKSIF